jgi:hypothetical protein
MSEMDKAEIIAMNKAEIIAELEKMAAARLFSREPWLADCETNSAYHRKLIEMGLVEQVPDEPPTWRNTPLGNELDIDLFQVFMGLWDEWEVPMILKEYGFLDESEVDAIFECASEANEYPSEANAERLLSGHVKRAYLDYRKAAKFLH